MANFFTLPNNTWIKVGSSATIIDLYFYNKFNTSYYVAIEEVDTLITNIHEATQIIIDASQVKRLEFAAPVDIWARAVGGAGVVRAEVLPDIDREALEDIETLKLEVASIEARITSDIPSYPTLAALQADDPAHDGIYLVTENNGLYKYDPGTSSWVFLYMNLTYQINSLISEVTRLNTVKTETTVTDAISQEVSRLDSEKADQLDLNIAESEIIRLDSEKASLISVQAIEGDLINLHNEDSRLDSEKASLVSVQAVEGDLVNLHNEDSRLDLAKAEQSDLDITNSDIDDLQTEVIRLETVKATKTALEAVASGSPAGSYATLADLQTADPAHDRIYLVRADQNWYYYDTTLTDWNSGGLYYDNLAVQNHVIDPLPHQFELGGVNYNYGFTLVDGFPAMVYEEVL